MDDSTMKPSFAAIVAAEVPPRAKVSSYPPPFAAHVAGRTKRPLGDLFGLRNFGVNLTTLAPGAASALHHVHSRQDEFIYVVEGEPTLVTDLGEARLRPGMVAGFPAGGTAHHLENRTDRDCVVLEIGDRTPGTPAATPTTTSRPCSDRTGDGTSRGRTVRRGEARRARGGRRARHDARMTGGDLPAIAARYRRFADEEAAGRSPLYEALARGIAGDEAVLRFLASLPEAKRQPNLLLAAFRHLFGVPDDLADFRQPLLAHAEAVRSVMLARTTQTNEPARCAALLPVLARLPQPLALIEVGAAAGLCLLPDHYGYDYGAARLQPEAPGSGYPIFSCTVGRTVPVPAALPRIAWRAGLDFHPLDAADPDAVRWLETLVWPGQDVRLAGLRAALRVAAATRPHAVPGDLLGEALPALLHEAPQGATTVVFHCAVLAYVADPAARRAFADRVSSLCDVWISCEAPGVFPEIARAAPPPAKAGSFLLSVNDRPLAWADPHGASLDWIADPAGKPGRDGRGNGEHV